MSDQHQGPAGDSCCSGGRSEPQPQLNRREFLTSSGIALAAASMGPGFAGPFLPQDRLPIPADKKLDPAWVRSLFARGEPEVVVGEDLRFIGMPVGGFFAGTVYLGGDGRLWNFDIFNQQHEGAVAREGVSYRGQALRERDGANYAAPPSQRSPFDLDVSLVVAGEPRLMDRRGWSSIRFRGEYPVGTVWNFEPGSLRHTCGARGLKIGVR